MTKLESSFLSFDSHLDELLLLIDNSEFVPKLKGSLNAMLNWGALGADQKQLVKDFFALKATPTRPLYNSIYISAVASFESYLVQTIEGVIEIINSKCKVFEDLPQTFVNRHIELTGKILSNVYTPLDHLSIDVFKVGRRLGTVYPKNTTIELNPEIASYVRNLLELDGFISFLENCGVTLDFDIIANDASVKLTFGTTKTRETANSIKSFLEEIKKLRNRIAHTGQSASDVSAESLKRVVGKLRILV